MSFTRNKIPHVTTISNSVKAGPHRVCWSGDGGRGSKLFESSCFGCCFCFPALSSVESPIFIAFNIMVVFTIYFVLVSSSSKYETSHILRESIAENPVPSLPPPKEFSFLKSLSKQLTQKMKYYQDCVLVMSAGILSVVSTVNILPACKYHLHICDSHRNFSLSHASI